MTTYIFCGIYNTENLLGVAGRAFQRMQELKHLPDEEDKND